MAIDSLEQLLIEEIKDLYDAEKQITKALPKLIKAASSPDLKSAFTEHLEQTKGQVTRLEEVFGHLETQAKSKPCAAMKGLIEEGQEQTKEDAEGAILDLMLIASAQKVEHYEISGYGTVRTLAEAIGNEEVAALLRQTEEEEAETDRKLSALATQLVEEASGETDEEEDDEDADDEDEEDDEELDEEEEEEPEEVTPAPAKKKAAAKKAR